MSIIQTNRFDGSAGAWWGGVSNTTSGFAFGQTNTSFTGGASAGEAGGQFIRTDDPQGWHYYGDTNLGGAFNWNASFAVTGRFAVANIVNADGAFGLGYFSKSLTDYSFVGINFLENTADSLRGYGAYQSGDGVNNDNVAGTFEGSPMYISTNSSWWFTMTYIPFAGADSSGSIRVMLTNGSSTLVFTQDVNAGTSAVTLDSFGFAVTGNAGSEDSTKYMHGYIDDVMYTTYLPEPTPIVLMGLGGLVITLMRRRGKS